MNKRMAAIGLMTVLGAVGLFSQTEMGDRKITRTTIFMDALSYAAPTMDKARLEVYIQIPYEEIRFLKKDDAYVGLFDITVAVTTEDAEPVWNRVLTVEVRAKEFSETVSNRLSSLKQVTFDMNPGKYNIRVEILDQDSKRTATVRREVTVPDYAAHRLSISDAMLVTRITTNGPRRTIVPNISGHIGTEDEGFFVFSEIYATSSMTNVTITGTILNSQRDSLYGFTQTDELNGSPYQSFLKFTRYELPMGQYFVRIGVTGRDSAGVLYAAQSIRTISVRWSDLPATITDLDQAIDQMRYIARDNEIEFIRQGVDDQEKRNRFVSFWRKRDPDPQSERNELMEEYYFRVDFANRSYSHYLSGWRTDRGMVYIRFGAPDNVERHPFETGTRPYEVWRYYNLNYEFYFIDETGFGDYRLQYPATDLLGRIRPDQ